jgi:hypothetical protein
MNIAWTRLKGVGLLLLGLATVGTARSHAADINTDGLGRLADTSTAVGVAETSPFKDEPSGTKSIVAQPATTLPGVAMSSAPAMPACDFDDYAGAPGRVWFRGEYVHWWTNGAHLPPLVSTVTDLANPVGSLATVYGGREVEDGDRSAYYMDLGMWLDRCHIWGIEGDYLDSNANPDNYDSGLSNGFYNGALYPIVRAFFDPGLGSIQLSGVGYPNQYVGRITVDNNEYFQSAGVWLRRQLKAAEWTSDGRDVNWTASTARTFRLDALAGYRFARLIGNTNERDDEMDIDSASTNYLSEYHFIDSYKAVTTYNGLDLGLDATYTLGRWSVDTVAKAAIGFSNEYVRLYGVSGIDPSNTGGTPLSATTVEEFSRDRFAAIPELKVTGGYQVTDHFKVTLGYDLLYWTAVVRAANQIAVNPATGYPYGTLVGSTLPAFSFNESGYFAQGIRLGGEFRF